MMAMLSARCWTMLPSILCAWKMSIRRCRFGELTSSKIPLAGQGEEHRSSPCVTGGRGREGLTLVLVLQEVARDDRDGLNEGCNTMLHMPCNGVLHIRPACTTVLEQVTHAQAAVHAVRGGQPCSTRWQQRTDCSQMSSWTLQLAPARQKGRQP